MSLQLSPLLEWPQKALAGNAQFFPQHSHKDSSGWEKPWQQQCWQLGRLLTGFRKLPSGPPQDGKLMSLLTVPMAMLQSGRKGLIFRIQINSTYVYWCSPWEGMFREKRGLALHCPAAPILVEKWGDHSSINACRVTLGAGAVRRKKFCLGRGRGNFGNEGF